MIAAPDMRFDDIVIGGGITGLCLAWFLGAEGAAVACLDGGSGGGSRANAGSLHVQMQSRLERQFPDRLSAFVSALPIYPQAVDFWSGVAAALDEDIELQLGGGLMVADDEAQLAALAAKCVIERRCGVETSILGRAELLRLAPWLDPQVAGACHCPQEGKVNPLLANAAIRRKAQQNGAVFFDDCLALRIEAEGHAYIVHTDCGRFRGARVVIAAGAGSEHLAKSLGFRLPVRAEALHMNITDAAEPFMHHLVQHADRPITLKQLANGQLLIGGGWPAHNVQQPATPQVGLDSVLGNLDLACRMVPAIRDLRLLRTWAGINPTSDLLSILGGVDSLPGVYAAIPGDAGYTLGPWCARQLVDDMQGRRPDYPLELFTPSRF